MECCGLPQLSKAQASLRNPKRSQGFALQNQKSSMTLTRSILNPETVFWNDFSAWFSNQSAEQKGYSTAFFTIL
jgi:hypothetical protein